MEANSNVVRGGPLLPDIELEHYRNPPGFPGLLPHQRTSVLSPPVGGKPPGPEQTSGSGGLTTYP